MKLFEISAEDYEKYLGKHLDQENPDDIFSRGERVDDYDVDDHASKSSIDAPEETMFDIKGADTLIDQNGNFPRYGYRVMHHKEWDKAKELGYFPSSESFYKRTHISAEPKTTYRGGPDPHYVVKFKLRQQDGWYGKRSSSNEIYGVTYEDIPFNTANIIQKI